MLLSFVDFEEKEELSERDGFSSVFMTLLSNMLNASGRVQVVDDFLIERLLEELNLGLSDLTNPETVIKLGKVLDVRIIGTVSIYHLPAGTLMSLRLIDTETFQLAKAITREFRPGVSLDKELSKLNREILTTLFQKYPLRGFVALASQDRIRINLGSKLGVNKDTKFELLKEQESIKYKGKILHPAPRTIAQLQVVQIEPDFCYAVIQNQEGPISLNDKMQEKTDNLKKNQLPETPS